MTYLVELPMVIPTSDIPNDVWDSSDMEEGWEPKTKGAPVTYGVTRQGMWYAI